MALSGTLAICLFVFGVVAVFAQDERGMPIPNQRLDAKSRKMSQVSTEKAPSPPKRGQTVRYIPSGSPKNSIPNDSKGKTVDTRRNLPRKKPQGPPRDIERSLQIERVGHEMIRLENAIAQGEERLRRLREQENRIGGAGPSGAGPSGAGPSGGGPSGAGPSGAGPSGAGGSRRPRH